MLYNGDCWTCVHQDDGEVCDCRRSQYYRYSCMFIRPRAATTTAGDPSRCRHRRRAGGAEGGVMAAVVEGRDSMEPYHDANGLRYSAGCPRRA